MRRLIAVLFVVLGCASTPSAPAPTLPPNQPSAAAPAQVVDELDRPIPLDARVTHGRLDSGLSYFILPHRRPEKRAQLWLAVNAGSVLEDDDQLGLAHFVEHMGFNGTRRFPKQQLVDFLEKTGMRFGADLNAHTSYDETVYTLQIPTDNPVALATALSVLRDWADGISFEPTEVEKERGVVLEEWRLGRGAQKRIFDKQAQALFHRSKYADRPVIGKPEVLKGASRDTLVRFYRDWYRPELMAVIAVGDFEAAQLETQIRAEFASLTAQPRPRPRAEVTVPPHTDTLVSVETDAELPIASVSIVSKLSHRPDASARDYRRGLGEQLFNRMLRLRFDELRQQPSAPFLAASSASSSLVRALDAFVQGAMVKEDAVERGLGALMGEVVRVERHGFNATELERAKVEILRDYEHAATERDKRDSSEFASELGRHFFEAEAMPGFEAELELVKRFLPTLTLEELNAVGKSLTQGSRLVTIVGPDKMAKPTPAAVLGLLDQVRAQKIDAYVDATPTVPLMHEAPKPGRVQSATHIPELEITEWTLENGVRVIVKPTTFNNDEVLMAAYSPGGTSLVKDADFESARFAHSVVAQGGLGPFDAVQLRKALSGRLVDVTATIAELEEGLGGSATPKDLEALFQMVYLRFTAPRRDPDSFSAWRAREIESVKNRRLSPEAAFFEDLSLFSTQNHRRRRPATPEALGEVDLDKAFAIYQDRFKDAGDFTFIFVGNVDLDRVRTLCEAYLGSLPTRHRKESWKYVRVRWPNGVKTKTVHRGREPKSQVVLTFHGNERWSRSAENDVHMLGEALRMRLRQVLREDLGGVYGVDVGGQIRRRPRPEYWFSVAFGCAPENVDQLVKAVFGEIAAAKQGGVDRDTIDKIKEARRRTHETELKENRFWLSELVDAYRHGDDPRLILDVEPLIAQVTSDRVRAAAKKYLTTQQYVLGVLKPEPASP